MTTNTDAVPLTSEQIEVGWRATFSTSNPFCPCDLKSFTKAVKWAEFALLSASKPAAITDEQADTLKLAIGYIGSSERKDRHEHVERIHAMLAAAPAAPSVEQDERGAFDAMEHQVLLGYDDSGDAIFGTDPKALAEWQARAAFPSAPSAERYPKPVPIDPPKPPNAQDERGAFDDWWGDDTSGPEALAAWNGWQARAASPSANVAQGAEAGHVPEGCTPSDAAMLREANHSLSAENDMLRMRLRPFAQIAVSKLSWAVIEYHVDGDPEQQVFRSLPMQRAFNRAVDALHENLLADCHEVDHGTHIEMVPHFGEPPRPADAPFTCETPGDAAPPAAPAQSGESIYQRLTQREPELWSDVSKTTFDVCAGKRRIVYAAPQPAQTEWALTEPAYSWMPIATAPRDGTNILIRFGQDGVSQAKYMPGVPYPWKFIDTNDGITWMVNTARDDEYGPSHWMPMPSPHKPEPGILNAAQPASGGDHD